MDTSKNIEVKRFRVINKNGETIGEGTFSDWMEAENWAAEISYGNHGWVLQEWVQGQWETRTRMGRT